MRRSVQIVVAVAALASASTLAGAQRGGGRQMGGSDARSNGSDMGRMGPPPIPPTVAALVLDHAKDLSLTDSQKVVLESIRKTQDSTNKPFLARLDSLKPTRMPAGGMGDLSQEQKDEMTQRSIAVQLVMSDMRDANAESRIKVMKLLTESQQKRAQELEEDAQKKADDEGRRRMENMGGGNRRGRPPEG
ncbi:MAG: Spy/CpxP family protein refolding chaperone [bacterium]